MKIKKLLALAFFLCATTLIAQNNYVPSKSLDTDNNQNFYEYVEEMNMYYNRLPADQRKGWKQFRRWQHFWEQRIDESGEFPSAKMLMDIFKEAKKIKTPDHLLSNKWERLGPIGSPDDNNARGRGIGRVNCLRLNPNNEQEIWIGAATGGVWKSNDGGKSWITFDYTNYLSMGVTDIQIAKSNPNVVYVSTGDAHATYPNVNRSCYSVGILKTTDGGNNWQITALADSIGDRGIMGKIVVDPRNENVVVASTSAGIMKTTDGGNSWSYKEPGPFFDLAYSPENPDILVATTFIKKGGASIFRSTDLGETWTKVETISGASRIDVVTQDAFPEAFWTISVNGTTAALLDIKMSDSYGAQFFTLYDAATKGVNLLGRSEGTGDDFYVGQGEYDLAMAIDPSDYQRIFVGGIEVWRTTNNTYSWDKKTLWYAGNAANYSHADHHDLVFNKSGSILYDCNDGGVFYSTDKGTTWKDLCYDMDIMQFHAFGNDQENGNTIAGAQDNGSSIKQGDKWSYIGGGDGFEGIITPTSTKYYFFSIYEGRISRSTNPTSNYNIFLTPKRVGDAGENGWQTPYILNPKNPYQMLVGYYDLYIGDIRDYRTFKKLGDFNDGRYISAIAVAESDTNTIYVAQQTSIYKTTDYGQTWASIYSGSNKITYLAVDPNNADRVWATVAGYNETNKVLLLEGDDITDLTGNLPNVPVLTIVYQKNSPDRLYIGTDLGVFVTDNGSNYWELLGAEMPNMIINELEIMENTNKLRACTYGRGIWETDLLTCNPTKINISSDSPDELCDGEVVTLTAEGNSDKYLWSNGETTKSIKVTETGYYSVAIPKDWGCSDKSEPKKVTFKQVPALTISVSGNLPLCGDDASVVFRAPYDFETYQWSNGATDRRIEISEPGIYYLSAETSNGCTAYSDTIVVEKYDLADVPTINRFSTDTLISSEAASYKWYKNGKIISGQNEQKLFISGDGDYSVQIVNDNGCSATSEDFPVNDLSIEELIEQGVLSVSENPSNGLFSISFNKNIENTVIVNVVNTLGELINKQYFDFASQGQMIEIDLRNQSKGMYFLNLTIGETQSMMKLIIQ